MSTVIAFLFVIAAWTVLLAALNHHDGFGLLAGRRNSPRSHAPDLFEPRLHR
ncbi:MAG: hypothetical protein ACR2FG_06270 [Marmoricola sp.]